MEKTRINLDILLPEVPNERDECVNRIVTRLQYEKGIEKVHIIPGNGDHKAQICFHYDPSTIAINEVEQLAKSAGAAITEHFGHLLIETSGIRHARHARIIETSIRDYRGIVSVSVSGSGFIQLEYKKDQTAENEIIDRIRKTGLSVKSVDDFHRHADGSLHVHDQHRERSHPSGGIFGERTELYFAIASGVFLGVGFALSFVNGISSYLPIGFYVGSYLFGGYYTGKEAIAGIRRREFDIDFLMFVAAIGAAILGAWAEGALLLFLFSLGHSLEHYAMQKAKKSIAALTDLAPKTALLIEGDDIKEVPIEELKRGDVILVKPNSKIAADGVVINGNSSVNQAAITGESIPVDKFPIEDTGVRNTDRLDNKHKVFAGSLNGSGTLEISVTKLASDSTVARLIRLVNEAQTQKSTTQNFADKLEKYYVPLILILVFLLHFAFLVIDEPFSKSFYRAMAVLVAASPCALAISTPSAVLSGVARAAKGGVLVKGGRPLEELGSLNAIAFDKTGTLTEGKPRLTGVYALNGVADNQLLETVIAVEKLSDHPLAAAIVKDGTQRLQNEVPAATNLKSITGRGINAEYGGAIIHIGNKELFTDNSQLLPPELKLKVEELEQLGHTTMLVQQNEKFIGIITLMDVARADAKQTLQELRELGIKKMIMLTGDNQKVAEAIAKEIGITDAWGNLLPEQKVEAIDKLTAGGKKVAMVGDGVNDAPAMAKSTVGIAMGAAGSDVALETADIALMSDKLSKLPFAIGLSKRAHSIIRQNLVISLGMVAILVPLTMFGIASMGPAVIGHEGSTVVVVFNALRLLAYKGRIPEQRSNNK